MSKWKVEQLLKTAKWCEENSSGIYRESAIAADMLRDYAAHLAAQAEWPSKEDVHCSHSWHILYTGTGREQWECANCFKRGPYAEHPVTRQGLEDSFNSGYRAALQSVRPPVGVVSDEDLLASVLTAAEDMLCFPYRGPDQDRLRAALERFHASRHAPTKD